MEETIEQLALCNANLTTAYLNLQKMYDSLRARYDESCRELGGTVAVLKTRERELNEMSVRYGEEHRKNDELAKKLREIMEENLILGGKMLLETGNPPKSWNVGEPIKASKRTTKNAKTLHASESKNETKEKNSAQ